MIKAFVGKDKQAPFYDRLSFTRRRIKILSEETQPVSKKDLPDCPVATTLRLIDSKWKVFILQRLQERSWRYNELKKSLTGISQKVLTDNLRSPETDGLVERKSFAGKTPHVEYSLTPLGWELKLVLDALYNFGVHYKKKKVLRFTT